MSYQWENDRYRGWPDIRAQYARGHSLGDPYALRLDDRPQRGQRPVEKTSFSRQTDKAGQPQTRRRGSDGQDDERKDDRKDSFVDYLFSTTGFQGPGKIREAPYRPLKVLWFLAFLVACGFMVFQLVELFGEFFSYPTKTVIKLRFSPLPLPAVTLCNMNPVRKSFANNLSCSLQDLLRISDDQRSEECVGFSVDLADVDFVDYYCEDCDDDYGHSDTIEDLESYDVRRENIAFYMADEIRPTRITVGHQFEDLVVQCSLFGRTCPFRNITSFLSRDYGNCYTLSAPNIKATRSGPETSLTLTLNLEAEEFIEGYKTGYGVRVVLHDNGTRPFPTTEGFTISSATENDIAIRMTQIKRKGGRYGKCDEGSFVAAVSGFKYSIANCRDQCLSKVMFEKCKCIVIEDEGSVNPTGGPVRFCSTEKEYKCAHDEWSRHMNSSAKSADDRCNCETPCDEVDYTSAVHSRSWPYLKHIPILEEEVCKQNENSPKCDYLNQNFTLENMEIRRAFARLRIYYDQLNYEHVEELPFYDTERFLSDIGGTLGLWIGVTALGLVELFELLLLAVFTCRRSPPPQPPSAAPAVN